MGNAVGVTRRALLKSGVGLLLLGGSAGTALHIIRSSKNISFDHHELLAIIQLPHPFDNRLLETTSNPVVDENRSITKSARIHCYKSEMGQGIQTLFAMLLAEELNTPLVQFDVKLADNPDQLGRAATVASDSARTLWQPLREMGAVFRVLLGQAAAQYWGCSVSECLVINGKVERRGTDDKLPWNELCAQFDNLSIPKVPTLKPPEQWQWLGQPQPQVALERLVQGSEPFTADIKLPKGCVAMLQRAPSVWHRWVSDNRIDLVNSDKLPGLLGIYSLNADVSPQFLDSVVIIGEQTWDCLQAKDLLSVQWQLTDASERLIPETIPAINKDLSATAVNSKTVTNALNDEAGAVKVWRADFRLPFVAHQTMETPACWVELADDHVSLWLPTQRADHVRQAVAELLVIDPVSVDLHPQRLGGGFGRKAYTDYAVEAVLVARLLKGNGIVRPVQCLWSRADDVQHDFYRPASVQTLEVTVDDRGKIKQWKQVSAFATQRTALDGEPPSPKKSSLKMGLSPLLYQTEAVDLSLLSMHSPVNVGIWRGVHYNQHLFAVESMVERIAHHMGQHPLDYRLSQLQTTSIKGRLGFGSGYEYHHARMQTVLRQLKAVMPETAAAGFATSFLFGSYVAVGARVVASTHQSEVWRIDKVVVVLDVGVVLNPLGAESQVEGSVIYALSAILFGELSVHQGGVTQSNFHDMPMLRADQVPIIDIHWVESDAAPGGLGETVVPCVAPSVANAVGHFTGQWIDELPLGNLRS